MSDGVLPPSQRTCWEVDVGGCKVSEHVSHVGVSAHTAAAEAAANLGPCSDRATAFYFNLIIHLTHISQPALPPAHQHCDGTCVISGTSQPPPPHPPPPPPSLCYPQTDRRWWRNNKDNHQHEAANYCVIITAIKEFIADASSAEGKKFLLFCWSRAIRILKWFDSKNLWRARSNQHLCFPFFFPECRRHKRKTSAASRDWVFAQPHLR